MRCYSVNRAWSSNNSLSSLLSVQLAQSADDSFGGVVLQQVFQEDSLCKRFLNMSVCLYLYTTNYTNFANYLMSLRQRNSLNYSFLVVFNKSRGFIMTLQYATCVFCFFLGLKKFLKFFDKNFSKLQNKALKTREF